jgi:peptidoglycan/LPS O-acetylase OafA/YrhL
LRYVYVRRAAFVVPLAIAIASYHLMERPVLQIKERLATQAHRRLFGRTVAHPRYEAKKREQDSSC